MKKALEELKKGGIWNYIRDGNLDELIKRVQRGIKTKIDQEIQLDSVLVITIGKIILK